MPAPRAHRGKLVIPPKVGPVNQARCDSPPMIDMQAARHPGQARFDYALGPHLDDRWGTRVLCGGLVRVAVLAAGEEGCLLNAIMVRRDSRGLGFARATLETLCDLADETALPLLIAPTPMEESVLPDRLGRFYASLGFQFTGHDVTMRRMPREEESHAVRNP